MSEPCQRDLACYRNDGHDGNHAYPTPDTRPQPALPDPTLTDPKSPVVDMFEEVRRWVAAIGSVDLDTGRRVTKADALLVIDRTLDGLR